MQYRLPPVELEQEELVKFKQKIIGERKSISSWLKELILKYLSE